MHQLQQEVPAHELTSLRAMMTNPTNVLNMMSSNGNGSMSQAPGNAPHGVPAPIEVAAIPPPIVLPVNGPPLEVPLPGVPDMPQDYNHSAQGSMYSDADMVPPVVPPAPEGVPEPHATHGIPAPHQGSDMMEKNPTKLSPDVEHSSGMGAGGEHCGVPLPESGGHSLAVDVPAPGSPEHVPAIPPPSIPDGEGEGDKEGGALAGGVVYSNTDPSLHQFVSSSEADHAGGNFHSPAFAGMSSAEANGINASGVQPDHEFLTFFVHFACIASTKHVH
jgi:hypothetical protein